MKTTLSGIVIGVVLLAFTPCVVAKGLDFEDLSPIGEGAGRIPPGYRGMSWSKNSYWITKRHLPDTGYEYGTVGRVSLFTAFGNNISLSGDMFSFYGAFVTSTWDGTEEVIVEGWHKGLRVYTKKITTHNDRAHWFDFEFKDIDTLRFLPLGRHIVIDNITFEPPVIEVQTDIKPGSLENSVNPKNKGRIPVAILTTDEFHAWETNPITVRFGPNLAPPVHSALEDVDGDGDMDMVLHFKTQDTGISTGDTAATLIGELFDGTSIEGVDSVRTVPRPK